MKVHYATYLKKYSRNLRSNMTDAEFKIWAYIRKKQLHNIQFYRQKPIKNYIVDFVSFNPKIIIEIDGSQHFEDENIIKDKERDKNLRTFGFKVIRYNDHVVLTNIEGIIENLDSLIKPDQIPPTLPFTKGGIKITEQ